MEGPPWAAQAGRARQASLGLGRHPADERLCQRDGQLPGERRGDPLGLVEAAPPATAPVERHRDDEVDVGEIGREPVDSHRGELRAEVVELMKLQAVHHPIERRTVLPEGDEAVERGRIEPAAAALRRSEAGETGDWASAVSAGRLGRTPEPGEARQAEAAGSPPAAPRTGAADAAVGSEQLEAEGDPGVAEHRHLGWSAGEARMKGKDGIGGGILPPRVAARPGCVVTPSKEAPLRRALSFLFLLALAATPMAAQGTEPYSFDLGLLGGVGGSADLKPDPGLTNPAFSAFALMVTERYTLVGVRAGRIEFDESKGFGSDLAKADLEYAALVGEYRYPKGYYDLGVYLGLGAYRVKGELPDGEARNETAVGFAFGLTGEFRLYRRLYLAAETNVHYAFLDEAHLFGGASIGLGLRF